MICPNMQRHRDQEFIRFLNAIEAEMPADKTIRVILDNNATHKQSSWLRAKCEAEPHRSARIRITPGFRKPSRPRRGPAGDGAAKN